MTRVRTLRAIDLHPHATINAGERGTVVDRNGATCMVRMDTYHPGLDEWDNGVVVANNVDNMESHTDADDWRVIPYRITPEPFSMEDFAQISATIQWIDCINHEVCGKLDTKDSLMLMLAASSKGLRELIETHATPDQIAALIWPASAVLVNFVDPGMT